ncbi:histidine phosphatase family protein [Geobacillus subterraneus]|uniref:histidine phosphatase family protein n=1 Tax=Geobacillus subterraneus TaxID=129338 RepID=UPI001442AF54|nr:histidine phosphatase family protein [Geobacillus subterraneus]QIZ67554.1 histidine phosphatase family protein [Geobacillus subterraneus]
METTLYLTRHGETKWNVEKRMQGWQDSPLTEKGRQDAKRLGKRLEVVELTAIYASTSGRALETAELVRGRRPIPIYQDERLREIHLGDWEGKTHDEIREMDPLAFDYFWNAPHRYAPERGERFFDVQQRALEAVRRIVRRHEGETVLIVTHGVVLKTLMAAFKGAPLDQLWAPPYMYGTSVTIVEVNADVFHLVVEGDVSHLEEVKEV